MGAFDGIRIPYDKGYPTEDFKRQYQYFSTQTAFSFFKGFGIEELRLLLSEAEANESDTVWVPSEYKDRSRIGLKAWYVRALIKEHFEDEE